MASADAISFFKSETATCFLQQKMSLYKICCFRRDHPEAWKFLLHECKVKFEVTVVIDAPFESYGTVLRELNGHIGWLIIEDESVRASVSLVFATLVSQWGLDKVSTISYTGSDGEYEHLF